MIHRLLQVMLICLGSGALLGLVLLFIAGLSEFFDVGGDYLFIIFISLIIIISIGIKRTLIWLAGMLVGFLLIGIAYLGFAGSLILIGEIDYWIKNKIRKTK